MRTGLWVMRLVLAALLVLVALVALLVLILVLADVLFRGVHSTIDLLVVLMVGLALGETRRFVDPLVGLVWMLLDVVLRLLLEVPEFTHAILPCLIGPGLPAWPRFCAPTPLPGTDA
jgi:hypothetical protein